MTEPANPTGSDDIGGCFFVREGQKYGPFRFEQLRQMAASGMLAHDDMVMTGATRGWTSAGRLDGLFVTPRLLPPVSAVSPSVPSGREDHHGPQTTSPEPLPPLEDTTSRSPGLLREVDRLRAELIRTPNDVATRQRYLVLRTPELREEDRNSFRPGNPWSAARAGAIAGGITGLIVWAVAGVVVPAFPGSKAGDNNHAQLLTASDKAGPFVSSGVGAVAGMLFFLHVWDLRRQRSRIAAELGPLPDDCPPDLNLARQRYLTPGDAQPKDGPLLKRATRRMALLLGWSVGAAVLLFIVAEGARTQLRAQGMSDIATAGGVLSAVLASGAAVIVVCLWIVRAFASLARGLSILFRSRGGKLDQTG